MNDITPEDIYAGFHYATMRVSKGIHVRRCTNFDKPKLKPEWQCFIKCANFCNSNRVDYREYLYCLASYFGGWFKPDLLGTAKSIKIYNDVKDKVIMPNDEEIMKQECDKIYKEIYDSLIYVVDYMIENNFNNPVEYLKDNIDLFPTVLQDLEDKKISIYFLSCFDYIKGIVSDYPQDMLDDYFEDYGKRLLIARSNVIAYEKTKKVANNIEVLISSLITKKKNNLKV